MLHKYGVISVFCAALFSVPQLTQAATLDKDDTQFMKMAAETSMTEAHLGQMAEARAGRRILRTSGRSCPRTIPVPTRSSVYSPTKPETRFRRRLGAIPPSLAWCI